MYHIKSGKWHWYFQDKHASFTPPADPSALLENADIIKNHAGTVVFRRDECFFKWEKYSSGSLIERLKRFFSPRIAREFATLSKLQRSGVVVTPPVAYAVSHNAGILVTGEVADAVAVVKYITGKYEKDEALSADFLASWGEFWGNFVNSGFYFPDFHCGNVLFVEKEHRFVLVDLQGVRKLPVLTNRHKERMIFRQIKDIMEFISTAELKLILKSAQVAANDEEFLKFLRLYASMANELLTRRLRRFDGKYLWNTPCRKRFAFKHTQELELPENIIEDIWLNDFALQTHGIPHLHLLERNQNNIIIEKPCAPASESAAIELRQRLEIAGYDPDDFGYCLNAGNRAVVYYKKLPL